jgi:hypothetical protein
LELNFIIKYPSMLHSVPESLENIKVVLLMRVDVSRQSGIDLLLLSKVIRLSVLDSIMEHRTVEANVWILVSEFRIEV